MLVGQNRRRRMEGGRQHGVVERVVKQRQPHDAREHVVARDGFEAQVGRPQVPAESRVDAVKRVTCHDDGELVDRQRFIRCTLVEAAQSVDDKARRRKAVARRVDRHAGEADQGAATLLRRNGRQQRVEAFAEAARKVDVLVAEQQPLGIGVRRTRGQRLGRVRGGAAGNDLGTHLAQAGRLLDIQAQLPIAGGGDHDRKYRGLGHWGTHTETQARLDHQALQAQAAFGRGTRHAQRVGQRVHARLQAGTRWWRVALAGQRGHPARIHQQLVGRGRRKMVQRAGLDRARFTLAQIGFEQLFERGESGAVGHAQHQRGLRCGASRQVAKQRHGVRDALQPVADHDQVRGFGRLVRFEPDTAGVPRQIGGTQGVAGRADLQHTTGRRQRRQEQLVEPAGRFRQRRGRAQIQGRSGQAGTSRKGKHQAHATARSRAAAGNAGMNASSSMPPKSGRIARAVVRSRGEVSIFRNCTRMNAACSVAHG